MILSFLNMYSSIYVFWMLLNIGKEKEYLITKVQYLFIRWYNFQIKHKNTQFLDIQTTRSLRL